MSSLIKFATDIVIESERIQNLSYKQVSADDEFPFPRIIATGDGGSINVSKKIDVLISQIALLMLENRPSIKSTHTDKEWIASVRSAAGPALRHIDFSADVGHNAAQLLESIKFTLSERGAKNVQREHIFGCSFLNNEQIQPIQIGPVRIEPRLEWLESKVSLGAISKISRNRIRRIWNGERLRKRKASMSAFNEADIISAVGQCPFVCSVSTDGLAPEVANLRAKMAARLALTSLAMMWHVPSYILSNFNLLMDGVVKRQIDIAFVSKGTEQQLLSYRSRTGSFNGEYIEIKEWLRLLHDFSDVLSVVGTVLDFFVSSDGKIERPRLMNTFAQSLIWFHEGCEEQIGFIAVVKFCASMDTLASGHKAKGILELIKARAGLNPDDPIQKDGTTVRKLVDRLYSDGRSKTIHGVNNKINHDWTRTRGAAEQLAQLCFLRCAEYVAKESPRDDPSLLRAK